MPFVPWIPESLWPSLVGALVGSLFASGIVGYLTQTWIEKRERRNRRDDLRLEVYLEVIDLIPENEVAIASSGREGSFGSVELQSKRLRVSHRLKLLGSKSVRDAYSTYRKLVFQETAQDIGGRPKSPEDVVRARDALIVAMEIDVKGEK